jgi:hypothetical protein
METVFCIDCEKEITIDGKKIINGFIVKQKDPILDEELFAYKCEKCYKKKPYLTNK